MVKPALSRHWKFFTASVTLWAIELEEPVPAPELMSLAALTLTSDPAACEVFLRAAVDAQAEACLDLYQRVAVIPVQGKTVLAWTRIAPNLELELELVQSFEKMLQTTHFGT